MPIDDWSSLVARNAPRARALPLEGPGAVPQPESRLIRLEARRHQFFVQDLRPWEVPRPGRFWTDEAFERLLAVGDGLIGVGAASSDVAVEVESVAAEPGQHLDAFDHVAEASLALQSPWLVVRGDDAAVALRVKPGYYRVRVHFASLHGPGAALDHEILVWPASPAPPRVLKQWPGATRFPSMA